ncbi:MAG: cytochrome C oxidase subunit II [Bacteroidetes bacterium]|nr:cytochrome C oxidase subunit II [Bacteroidota bacterium]
MHLFSILLTIQGTAAVISLIGAVVVAGVVLFVVSTSHKPDTDHTAKTKVYKFRGKYFAGLLAVIVVGFALSMATLPYPQFQKDAPDQTVVVVGSQWMWKMAVSDDGTVPADVAKFKGTSTITLPANKTLKFWVSASDVNHNYAIYDANGELLAQTQAMPGYWNALQYRFSTPGTYTILCLEYCGAPHTVMTGKINVQ